MYQLEHTPGDGESRAGKRHRSEHVYRTLRDRILGGEIPQGQRLVVAPLAAEFGTSDIPVREALKMLQRDGLVTIAPHRGAQVVELAVRDIAAAYLLRGSLEGLATRLAGPQLTPSDLLGLEDLCEQMTAAASKPDIPAYYALNRAFHSAIFAACPYPLITETLERTWDRQTRFGLVFSLDQHALDSSMRDHQRLVALLRDQRWADAETLARQHKHTVGRRLLRALGEPVPDALIDSK